MNIVFALLLLQGLVDSLIFFIILQGKGHPPATPTGLGPSSSSTDNLASSSGASNNMGGASAGGGTPQGESAPIRAPVSLWRCSRIMHLLRDLHPTLLSALEGIVDQVRKVKTSLKQHSIRRKLHVCRVQRLYPRHPRDS